MEGLDRRNEIELTKLRGELTLLGQKLDTIKGNDLFHIQKSIDGINRVLWAVGLLVLGHLGVAVKMALWS